MREFRKTSRKTMKPFDWSFWNGMAFDVSAPRRQECDMACSAAVQIVPSLWGVINQLQVLACTGQSEPFVDLLDGNHPTVDCACHPSPFPTCFETFSFVWTNEPKCDWLANQHKRFRANISTSRARSWNSLGCRMRTRSQDPMILGSQRLPSKQ